MIFTWQVYADWMDLYLVLVPLNYFLITARLILVKMDEYREDPERSSKIDSVPFLGAVNHLLKEAKRWPAAALLLMWPLLGILILILLLFGQAPDAVICVHLFPAMMMTELRCSYGVRIPTYFVATDFTCSPGVGDLQVDGLCIPHRDLIPEFVTAGLPQERLFPTGIPVGQQFLHPESREEARRALDLPVDGRILTLACGSMGAGPLRTTAQKVAELMGPEDLLVTICGSNHRMYQQMQSDFFRPVDRVRVLGYTHEMFRYMYASDLLLTKAGGLTTAEAVAAGTPLLYLNAVPGCESHNIDFMTRHGCALAVSSDEELQPMLQGILSGAIDPRSMVARRADFPTASAAAVCDLALRHAGA